MTTKWRIYCTEPGDIGWQTAWSDTAITTCPNNAAHSVNTNSVSKIGSEVEAFRIGPSKEYHKNSNFSRLIRFNYSADEYGPLRRVKFVGRMEGDITSYDIEIYDITNRTSLIVTNFANTNDDILLDVGAVSNPPIGNVNIEINGKRTGGKVNDEFYIEQIIVYGEK